MLTGAMNPQGPAVVTSGMGRRIVVVALLLGTACSSGGDTGPPAAAPTDDPVAPVLDLLFGGETDSTIVVAPGYGLLYAIDLDTGLAQRFPTTGGVPGDFDHRLIALPTGVVFPGADSTRRLAWTLEAPSTSLGHSFFPIPSGRPDHVWLVGERRDGGDNYPDDVREVNGQGHESTPSAGLPAGWPLTGVADLVVVQARHELLLFDAEAGVVRRRLPGTTVLDARGTQMAWVEPCVNCGTRIRVLDLGPDPRSPFVVEVGAHPFAGRLSPDGRWLAAWVPDGEERSGALFLIDLVGGGVTEIPGSRAGPYANLAWSADGSWVFAVGSQEGRLGAFLVGHELGGELAVTRWSPSLQSGTVAVAPAVGGPDLTVGDAAACPEAVAPDHNTNPQAAVSAGRACRIRLD